MSSKERVRLLVFNKVKDGLANVAEAGRKLGICYKQALRSYKRWVSEGDQGLVHKSRGRESNRKADQAFRDKVLGCYRERYSGVGPTLTSELIERYDDIVINRHTLRSWLIKEGLWAPDKRRSPTHRSRKRKAHFGEMVQFDGSLHCWFGDGRPRTCLMNMIDDATGITLALMSEEETTEAAMRLLSLWIAKYGIPRSLYLDGRNVYLTDREASVEEQIACQEPVTHFGLACRKLGIRIIHAHSPQAKGRVERSNGVYQGRLIPELRLKGITALEATNAFLPSFCDNLNDKFAVVAELSEDYHRIVSPDLDLDTVFCWEYKRKVSQDYVVRIDNRNLQLLPRPSRPAPKSSVTVQRWLDGSLHIWYSGRDVEFIEVTASQLQEARQAARQQPPKPPAASKSQPPCPLRKRSAQECRKHDRAMRDGSEIIRQLAAAELGTSNLEEAAYDTHSYDEDVDISRYL